MPTREFVFSSLLLLFTGTLMVLGTGLLVDAARRIILDSYKGLRPKRVAPADPLPSAQQPENKIPPLEHAA
jgi:hypothetical protein